MNYILLPVHNRRAITEAFVCALKRQTVQDFHLLLIDDGSVDGTAEAVRKLLANQVTVLRGVGDWWWGGALHQGWLWLGRQSIAGDDVVVICNDDVDLPDDFLSSGLALLSEKPDALAVAKARDAATGVLAETCFAVDYKRCKVTVAKPEETVICAPTRGVFIHWKDMRRIGDFRPQLIPHYLSDLEWTSRATRRGMSIIRDDRLWIVPHHDKTGVHDMRGLPLGRRLRCLFSPKYAGNPLHWGAFILLSFPPRHWVSALTRISVWTVGAVLGR